MVDWIFAIKMFGISLGGTFFAMGILTTVIWIMGCYFSSLENSTNNGE